MSFIIRRFKKLSIKSKRFSGKTNGFRGSSSKGNTNNQKNCFKCKKPGHFIVDCPNLKKDISKKGSFQKYNFSNKLKKCLMVTWDELDNKDETDKDEGEANLALMATTPSNTKYESTSGSYSDGEDEVFSSLSRFDLISFIQELMSRCQDKVRPMKTLKKEYDLLKQELKISQNKVETLEKDHIILINKADKNLSEQEIALQDFIITGLERTKITSIIYGVSKIKGEV